MNRLFVLIFCVLFLSIVVNAQALRENNKYVKQFECKTKQYKQILLNQNYVLYEFLDSTPIKYDTNYYFKYCMYLDSTESYDLLRFDGQAIYILCNKCEEEQLFFDYNFKKGDKWQILYSANNRVFKNIELELVAIKHVRGDTLYYVECKNIHMITNMITVKSFVLSYNYGFKNIVLLDGKRNDDLIKCKCRI